MTRDELVMVIEAMRKYGGSFVKALAHCFMVADHINLRKLEAAFPDEIRAYQKLIKNLHTGPKDQEIFGFNGLPYDEEGGQND
jgi:hypothetical protein